ncbi:MAG: TRAP transporter substrate-binding protein [Peptococcaceae bacterium]|nr:TRAP transporter substrate-binding protein [Peptococcaceae bacterium]
MSKKLVAFLSCILVALMLLAGCGSTKSNSGDQKQSGASSATDGKVYELTLHHHDPPTSAQGIFFEKFAAEVNKKSNGKLKINVFHGGQLGSAKDTYDMILNGTCDIGGGLPSFFPGRFPMTEALSLPMIGVKNSAQATKALWELYESTPYLKNEYSNFKMLMLVAMNDSAIATKNKEIKSVEDLKGMKVRVNSGPPTVFLKESGATPVSIVIGELYSALEKGVIDGVITDWNAFNAFKLHDQLKYYVDEHITVNSYFVLMNKKKYESLPADLQKVLDDCSGANALDSFAAEFDKVTSNVKKVIEEKNGKIYTLSDTERAKLKKIAESASSKWVEEMSAKGLPAKETMNKVAELLGKYK